MTYEAQAAVRSGYQFECKKDGFKQNQDGAVKLTLTVQKDDINRDFSEFLMDDMGQRYMAVMVPINEDETPREVPVTPNAVAAPQASAKAGNKPMPLSSRAKLMSQSPEFLDYSGLKEQASAESWLKHYCGVESCSEIKEETEAGKKFLELRQAFLNWRNTPPIEAYEN